MSKFLKEEEGIRTLLSRVPIKKHRAIAADIAESVIHFYEDRYPNDDTAKRAIEAARSGDQKEMNIARSDINSARVRITDPSFSASYYNSRAAARAVYWCCITDQKNDCSTIAAERAANSVYVCSKEAHKKIPSIIKKYIGKDDNEYV